MASPRKEQKLRASNDQLDQGQDSVPDSVEFGDEQEAAEREAVEREQDKLREFVSTLSMTDIRSGNWFEKLCAYALHAYTEKVDWQYFQQKYPGVPADLIVDQRIKMASRYASLEGGLSAGAYTGAVATTIGSAGGASPIAVPAAVTTVMVDIVYLTRLQLHLAYDIAVLYRVPLDLTDPDDLWKLIKVAFAIKAGEAVGGGAMRMVPLMVRPLVRRFIAGPNLAAVRALPVVGRHLLQRNIIKIGIPAVGVPLAVGINFYSTKVIGAHARSVFRNEARIIEIADRVCRRTQHPQLMLWVSLALILADRKTSDDETMLLQHLVQKVEECHGVVDEEFSQVIELELSDVWARVRAEPGDKSDLVYAAEQAAAVDGTLNKQELSVIHELRDHCR